MSSEPRFISKGPATYMSDGHQYNSEINDGQIPPHIHQGDYGEERNTGPSEIFGLRWSKFWLIFILIFALLAILIGGSVGGALKTQRQYASSPLFYVLFSYESSRTKYRAQELCLSYAQNYTVTTTKSTTQISTLPTPACATPTPRIDPYIAIPLAQVKSVDVKCPSSILDMNIGAPNLKGRRYSCQDSVNSNDTDLIAFTAYTLEQCVNACSQYSLKWTKQPCAAAVIGGDIEKRRNIGDGSNCWLKTGNLKSFAQSGFTLVTSLAK
ncbi:hypothetical protein GQ44DRAFT_714884 [Phaeosphaeriaceae sp. PMI808]|nr:hypothetical protein GQ44DRAFT_714884 [Phaeosphaeriaceae sp. PMI808]